MIKKKPSKTGRVATPRQREAGLNNLKKGMGRFKNNSKAAREAQKIAQPIINKTIAENKSYRKLSEIMVEIMHKPLKHSKAVQIAKDVGLPLEQVTYAHAGLYNMAIIGAGLDTHYENQSPAAAIAANNAMRDLTGEKPSDKVETTLNIDPEILTVLANAISQEVEDDFPEMVIEGGVISHNPGKQTL